MDQAKCGIATHSLARQVHSAIGLIFLMAGSTTLYAQTSSSATLMEELLVTAQKREQSLQDVSVGVSLLTSQVIEEAMLYNASELTRLIPTLNAQTGAGPSDSSFNIRGIGTQAFSPGVEPSVSTMIDGVVLSRSGMAFSQLLDVQRIEVLRGPQGTLYGKNASGGVIHVITRDPSEALSGTVTASAIERGEYRLGFTVSGPLTDTFAYRLTATGLSDDGYSKNVYNGEKLNSSNSWSTRLKLKWQPSDDVQFLWASDYSREDCKCNALSVRAILEGPDQEDLLQELLPVIPSDDNFNANLDQRTSNKWQGFGHALTVNWTVGEYTLTSISAYREWENTRVGDIDGRPINALSLSYDQPPKNDIDQLSQELRLTSPLMNWGSFVIGAYYYEQSNDGINEVTTSFLADISGLPFPPTTSKSTVGTEGVNYAVFGETSINLNEQWRLILGGRYTHDNLEYEVERVGSDNLLFPPEFPLTGDDLSEGNLSGKLALEWDASDDAMVYASYTQGYKGPAFDPSATGSEGLASPVDAETSDAFEVGVKSLWLDGKLVVNATAFYSDYDNFQAQALIDENPDDQLPAKFLLINAGEVSTRGLELEFMASPSESWSLMGGITYTDARIDNYPGGNCSQGQIFRGECPDGSQDLSGGTLPYTPKWKIVLGTSYDIALSDMPFYLNVGGNILSQDKVLYEISQDKYTEQDAYTVVDLSAGLVDKNGHYKITGFIKNVFDQDYASLIFAHADVLIPHGYIHFMPKYARRTVGIELRYDWF